MSASIWRGVNPLLLPFAFHPGRPRERESLIERTRVHPASTLAACKTLETEQTSQVLQLKVKVSAIRAQRRPFVTGARAPSGTPLCGPRRGRRAPFASYKVKLVGDAPPGPPPNCGRKCSSDSDCQTGGFVQYPTCYVNSGTMCHGYCGP